MTTVVCDLGARDAGATLVDAFSTQGYAALVGHGVPDDVIDDMRAVSLEFFDLPREEKARCEWVGHDVWRGWQPVFEGGERFADDSTVEWREWLEENLCPAAGGPDNALNNWPPVPVALRPAWEAYHAAMFELAARVIGLLAARARRSTRRCCRRGRTASTPTWWPTTTRPRRWRRSPARCG